MDRSIKKSSLMTVNSFIVYISVTARSKI